MAKEKFQRTKPHVNVSRQRLGQLGMTPTGIEQLISGNPVSNADDRQLIAQIVGMAMDTASCWIRVQQLQTTGS